MKHYIDIGSATVKIYSSDGTRLDLVGERSLFFKDGFDAGNCISQEKTDALIEFLYEQSLPLETQAFATGIWRETPKQQIELINKQLLNKVGFMLNVISHEKEGEYLKLASDLNYGNKKVLVINMGGKTTEVVTHNHNGTTSTLLLPIGVAEINTTFPEINNSVSGSQISAIEKFCESKIADIKFDTDYDFTLFSGELRFEKLSKYPLQANTCFSDANHPFQVSLEGFVSGTKHIFYDLTMDELRKLMPSNPKWMDGARAGAVLPMAIFKHAGIEIIVPSDVNLINGVIKAEENND